jgi:3',5'-cyclic AMP phosphodiesterase CpdA
MRIAHFSDLHVLDLAGVDATRLWTNKRATGMVNLRLNRGHKHKQHAVEAIVADVRAHNVDHVVITGDLSNLALETEFARVRTMIEALGMSPEQVSVVPGNHDLYTRGSLRTQRFFNAFRAYMTDEHGAAHEDHHGSGVFPFTRVRDGVAIVGVSSAVPRVPVVSAGHVGVAQMNALRSVLTEPSLRDLVPVVLMHHPVINPRGRWRTLSRGLAEAHVMRELLSQREGEVLFLHGHLHDRGHREWTGASGATVHHVGATSASLLHEHPDKSAGYNVYEVDGGHVKSVAARVYDARSGAFRDEVVSKKSAAFAD